MPFRISLALLALSTTFGHAAEDSTPEELVIPEIVVTANFRRDELNRIPASITVITEDAIKSRGAQHLEEILALAPNVNIAKGSSRARFIQIRGIGERGQFAEPLNSSVGLMVDGVDFSGIGTTATLFDVQQVEILRGPQGTIYGANALAGLINIRTNPATEEFDANAMAEVGNYDSFSLGGAISGPVGERTRYRLSGQLHQSSGFMHNTFRGSRSKDDRDEITLRGKLSWDVGDATVVNLNVGYIDIDNGYDAFSLDNDRNTLSDEPGHDRQESTYAGLEVLWNNSGNYTVEGHFGLAVSDIEYGYDEDWAFVGFHAFEYSSTDNYRRDRDTATGEVRFVSKEPGKIFNGSTHWTAGIFALRQEVSLTRTYTFLPADFTSRFDIDRIAIFGQTETDLSSRLTLTVGLRLENHGSTYEDNEGVRFTPDDDLIGGRVALDYLVGDKTIVYGSISRGYKAGGFNTDGTLDADLREFDPETLYNFEVGVKGQWLNDSVAGRIAAFYMRRDDVQISSSIVRIRPDNSAEFIDFVGNAAEGTNGGLEAEFLYFPRHDLELFLNVGLLNTQYQDFINATGEDLDGRDQAHAPSYQFSVGGEYRFAQYFYARLEFDGRDEFFFSDSHNEKSKSYAIINATVGWQRNDWSVRAWGRNLSNKDYFVRGFFFGNDPRDNYTPRAFTQLGEPRRLGISVTREW
ncbi:MAG: TonB-dependent receptor [Gammaproteobacteria bacterium]|nr:TonB-dependent receptor [Gammaproteobacteria bacterium]